MSEESKVEALKQLINLIQNKENIIEVNLPQLLKLIEEGAITPEEFDGLFQKNKGM
jgi:hypothetical protein